jgi:hypothetical protein
VESGKYYQVKEKHTSRINEPSEKKLVGGWEGTLGGTFLGGSLLSSTEILALFNDVGRNKVVDSTSNVSRGSAESSTSSPAVLSTNGRAEVFIDRGLSNTNPGLRPAPNTRSGGGATGSFCLGAGNMLNNDEEPAPEFSRCFFTGGLPASISSSGSAGNVGSPIVIFLAGRLAFIDAFEPVVAGFTGAGCLKGKACVSLAGVGAFGGYSLSLSLP